MKVRCLIVEDEPIAREILKSYINKTDSFELVDWYGNAIEAFNFLQAHNVDLLFLDIKMPQMSGLDLLKAITHKPKVIITSAYRYYATDAFEMDVIDYLLKPYSFERFLKAVGKALVTGVDQKAPLLTGAPEKPHMFVKGNKQLHKVHLDDILYIESQRDYLKLFLSNQQEITTRQTIAHYEAFLPAPLFARVHRSFIVAISKISVVEANRIMIGKISIPVGRNYKQQALQAFRQPNADN
jgi:DNA-binding LytR/AlgR family response regulator